MDVSIVEIYRRYKQELENELFQWDVLLEGVEFLSHMDSLKVTEDLEKLNLALGDLIVLFQKIQQKHFSRFIKTRLLTKHHHQKSI